MAQRITSLAERLDATYPLLCAICGADVRRIDNASLLCRACGHSQNGPEAKVMETFKRKGESHRNEQASRAIQEAAQKVWCGYWSLARAMQFVARAYDMEENTVAALIEIQAQYIRDGMRESGRDSDYCGDPDVERVFGGPDAMARLRLVP